jgi:type I restriction-modification system DNA methylase subunit
MNTSYGLSSGTNTKFYEIVELEVEMVRANENNKMKNNRRTHDPSEGRIGFASNNKEMLQIC